MPDTFRWMVAACPFGPAGEFAASCHGALTRSQAATSGLSAKVVARLLRHGVLTEPVPGVLVVVGSPPTWRQQLYVATLASKGAGVASDYSAAALLGMDDFEQGPLELLVPGHRHIDLPGVTVRQGPLHRADVIVIDGIASTGVARTLCDIASCASVVRTGIAFEWAWRNGCSLTWIEHTAKRLNRRGVVGPRVVLGMVDDARHHDRPTESALEVKVEAAIAGLPGLVRQHTITTADGRFVARVDFAIPALKIAIEAHSRRRHFGIAATDNDGDREADIQAQGWIVRFVTDGHRRDPDTLRRSLLALIEARAVAIGRPP